MCPGRREVEVPSVYEAGADGVDEAIPVEYLRVLDASGLPPGELAVKIGCPLILLCNLAPSRGLCNGTRMTLLWTTQHVLEVQILGGDHNGQISLRMSKRKTGAVKSITAVAGHNVSAVNGLWADNCRR